MSVSRPVTRNANAAIVRPDHIVISAGSSPSVSPPQTSYRQYSPRAEKQILQHELITSSTPTTATGISLNGPRIQLMPAPTTGAFRAANTTSQTAVRAMASNMLPQPVQAQPSATPTANGPLSRPVQVPARAKPGRKAMDNSEKEDRRRKQNRNAQRNYRDRRSQQVAELSDEVKDLQQQGRDAYSQHLQEMQQVIAEQQQLRADMQKAREEAQRWVEKANYFERAFNQVAALLPRDERERFRELPLPQPQQTVQIMRPQAPLPDFSTISLPPLSAEEKMVEEDLPPTPPEDGPNETDFTQIWLQNRTATTQQNSDPISATADDLAMSCGFCSDNDYCPCKEAAIEPIDTLAPVVQQQQQQPTDTSTGPGTCDMCQRDPARAEACRSLAGRTKPSTSPPATKVNKTMNCGQFIDRANRNLGRMPSIAEILGPLHSYPAANGFDVNEQEAAVVLQNMATRLSP